MTVIVPLSPRRAAETTAPVVAPVGLARSDADRDRWAAQRHGMERRRGRVNPGIDYRSEGRRVFRVGISAFAWAMKLIGLYGRGRRNALAPRLVARDFFFADLPAAFDGYRILHLSDTHLDCLPEVAGVARHLLTGISVDLVALTGDIHGRAHAPVARSTLPLAEVLAGPKVNDRIVAVLGNHDPAAMVDALAHLGITTLVNESLIIDRDGERLVLTGLDDVHRFYTPAADAALMASPDGFRVALVHSAEVADRAADAGFALYLCGHTHGGQICLPGGRPLFTMLHRCRFGARGEWRYGGMIGYTSTGLGVGRVPLRFNCPGEIAVITLRRGMVGN